MGTLRKQAIHLPESMVRDIEKRATRLDTSTSSIVTRAWEGARANLARKTSDHPTSLASDLVSERKVKNDYVFSPMTLQEISDEAARLDRSLSWIIREAWFCAAPAVEAPRPKR